jgi:carbamoyl-phosphate synthase small subunit
VKERRMFLKLEDGTLWPGMGWKETPAGEVVFDTAVSGYPQALTDPSFEGQIVVFAFPMLGTYGVDVERLESENAKARGLVAAFIEEGTAAGGTLKEWLALNGVAWLQGIDTRSLVRHIREKGVLKGAIVAQSQRAIDQTDGVHPVRAVSTRRITEIAGAGPHIAVLDYGVKQGILRELEARDCHIIRFPHDAKPKEILAYEPDGVLLGNGPGDPALLEEETKTVRLLAECIPVAGICLGMQLLALALGSRTQKMRYGHRGANHAVLHIPSGRGWLTSQNHGYEVVEESLARVGFDVTHRNLGDGSVEGIRHKTLPLMGVQYHPEGSPGPRDGIRFFDEFLDMVKGVSL